MLAPNCWMRQSGNFVPLSCLRIISVRLAPGSTDLKDSPCPMIQIGWCCSAAVLHSPALTAAWALQCCMPPVQPVSSWDQERNSASDRMTETALHLLILWILSRLAPNWKYSSQIETKKWETMRKCSGLSSSMVADYLQAFSDFNLKADITTDT